MILLFCSVLFGIGFVPAKDSNDRVMEAVRVAGEKLETYDPSDPLIVNQHLVAWEKIVQDNAGEDNIVFAEAILVRTIKDAEGVDKAHEYWLGMLERHRDELRIYQDLVFLYVQFCLRQQRNLEKKILRQAIDLAEEQIEGDIGRPRYLIAIRRLTAELYWVAFDDKRSAVKLAIGTYELEREDNKARREEPEPEKDWRFDFTTYASAASDYASLESYAARGPGFAKIVVEELDQFESARYQNHFTGIRADALQFLGGDFSPVDLPMSDRPRFLRMILLVGTFSVRVVLWFSS